jgi:hypothetical protein
VIFTPGTMLSFGIAGAEPGAADVTALEVAADGDAATDDGADDGADDVGAAAEDDAAADGEADALADFLLELHAAKATTATAKPATTTNPRRGGRLRLAPTMSSPPDWVPRRILVTPRSMLKGNGSPRPAQIRETAIGLRRGYEHAPGRVKRTIVFSATSAQSLFRGAAAVERARGIDGCAAHSPAQRNAPSRRSVSLAALSTRG